MGEATGYRCVYLFEKLLNSGRGVLFLDPAVLNILESEAGCRGRFNENAREPVQRGKTPREQGLGGDLRFETRDESWVLCRDTAAGLFGE